MESPQALQQRIQSLGDLQQIVRTMKALSAVSIRQYERAVETLADAEQCIQLGFQVALRDGVQALPDRGRGGRGAAGVIVFGTDHGLCGRFNEVIAEQALEQASEQASEQAPGEQAPAAMHWLAVGERLLPLLDQQGQLEWMQVPSSAAGITAVVQRVLLRVDDWRAQGVGRVELFHNRPSGRSGYAPTRQQLFPFDRERFQRFAQRPWPSRQLPQAMMPKPALLRHLLRQHYFFMLFRALAESLTAEHGGRLAAMQAAEKNIDERLEEVTGRFRRVRQEQITSELLDVVSGFEAVS
ncbi:F0F1 ATP synthase subunit gamma [Lamprobacter modestohalophilus]|uniref:F0F1 ATP synthase subunit gamma n=1 Tax=Lamprobacter modestohalophilus TaxID=1064514 RepID=UPI002ADED9EB|nr:F0F1 ATP synthase subunit gamma [Lamprobacter modestohalophilus]MEA1053056.1 F0F1 ATP synthase subunit gamma [Lamprobacter modestohalophilus]